MIRRFCAYAVLRNLRFFDPFMVLFLLHDLQLDYTEVGLIIGYEKALTSLLEVPLAVVADRYGRRRTLVWSFVLASFAMLGLAFAERTGTPMVMVLASLALYAVAEALRTGTHKSMILDWLTRHGQRDRKVEVLGVTRAYSKTSEGASAMLGGVIVWLGGAYSPLFFAAAAPTVLGAFLVASYPRELDESDPAGVGAGEVSKESKQSKQPKQRTSVMAHLRRFAAAARRPGLLALIIPSVLFESQVKLAASWLQPALAEGIDDMNLAVVGGIGAVVYGAWHLTSGLLAGGASLLSTTLVRVSGGVHRALFAAHVTAAVVLGVTAAGFVGGLLAPGLVLMLGLGAVQNGRRPIFVSTVDDVMDPRWRTTTLSAENVAREVSSALSAVALGVIADHAGLGVAFAVMAALVGVAAVYGIGRK
ncbi:MAG: MFS transporter [bacterium]|nr:MFS transporter [Myxococcales bacterium]MCB9552282.1 MFS transporter [Myxococcales bacterium]